ncbi:MAG: hypothetical protein ACRDA4_04325 [Filifactoraceae bacterium]
MRKEPLKSLSIILLFISATFLSGFKFDFFANFKQNVNYQISSINPQEVIHDVIIPSYITVNLGNKGRTVLYNQNPIYYSEAMKILREALESNEVLTEANVEMYNKQKDIKSLEIKFDSSVDSRLLRRSLFLDKSLIDDIGKINEILIPLVDDNSIYLKVVDKVFRIQLKNRPNIESIDVLSSSNPNKFYTLKDLYDVDSLAITSLEGGVDQVSYETSSKYTDMEVKDSIAERIFGEKYDFISKTTEVDESATYTYNFGQEYLKIKSSGLIEYINEDTGSESEADFDKSLDVALNFLNVLDFDLSTLKFEDINKTIINEKNGYRIVFLVDIDGFEVHTSIPSHVINIEVVGNKVYSFKGINRQVQNPIANSREVLLPMDVISLNYEMFKLGLDFETGNQLIGLISDIKQVYRLDSEYRLRPCYNINIGFREYYFDIYTGEEVGNGLV